MKLMILDGNSIVNRAFYGIRMLNANISRFDLFFEQKPNSMFISYEELIRTLSERETMPEMLVMEYLSLIHI